MSTTNPNPMISRNTALGLGLVTLVVACGFGGMLASRHILHPNEAIAASRAESHPPPATIPDFLPQPAPVTKQGVPPDSPGPSGSEDPALPRVTKSPLPASPPVPAVVAGPGDQTPAALTDDKQIALALHRWQEALLSNDARRIVPSYAPQLDRYFLQTHVTRDYVQRYMAREEDRGSWLLDYDLRDVNIAHDGPDTAEVRFDAKFTVSAARGERSGRARTELKMRREDGDWKIYSERDFRP